MGAHETELRLAWERATGRSRAARSLLEGLLERHRQPHRRYHGVRHLVWVVRHVHELAAVEPVTDLDAVVVAACYHDAVHLGRPGEDEQASAELARRELAELTRRELAELTRRELAELTRRELAELTRREATDSGDAGSDWTAERIERVARLVLATAHLPSSPDGSSADSPGPDSAGPDSAGPDSPGPDSAGPADGDAAVLVDADLAVLGAPPAAYLDYARGVRAEHPGLDESAWRTGRAAVLRRLLARPTIYTTPTARTRWEARARANLTAELAGLGPPPMQAAPPPSSALDRSPGSVSRTARPDEPPG